MPRDLIILDPAVPLAGADAIEELLWQGRCPWCGGLAGFYPSEETYRSLICVLCGCEFMGTFDDQWGEGPQRTVTAVYVEGDAGMKIAAADDLPAATARP